MKPVAVLAALAFAFSTPLAAQEAPSEEMAEARAIMAVMFPTESRDAQMRDMMAAMAAQMKEGMGGAALTADPGLNALLDSYLAALPETLMPLVRIHFPQILEATAGAYTREFSLEELRDLRRFAATPTGAHYFSRNTAMLSDPAVASANARYFSALKQLQEAEGEKLKAKVIDYLQKNPDAAKRLSAGKKK